MATTKTNDNSYTSIIERCLGRRLLVIQKSGAQIDGFITKVDVEGQTLTLSVQQSIVLPSSEIQDLKLLDCSESLALKSAPNNSSHLISSSPSSFKPTTHSSIKSITQKNHGVSKLKPKPKPPFTSSKK